jgi:hypothetical protein
VSAARFLESLLGGEQVEWMPLGEIATVQRGASPRPISKFITNNADGVPWIKIGDTVPGSQYVTHTAQKITQEGAKKLYFRDRWCNSRWMGINKWVSRKIRLWLFILLSFLQSRTKLLADEDQ